MANHVALGARRGVHILSKPLEASLSKEWPFVCGLGLTRAACMYHPEPRKGASREEGKGDIQEPPQGANRLDLKKTS